MIKFAIEQLPELRMAMAAQGKKDVRYYLNGVCFDFKDIEPVESTSAIKDVPLVATDGSIIIDSPVEVFCTDEIPFGKDLILFIDGTIPKTAYRGEFEVKAFGDGTLTLFKKGKDTPMKIIPVRYVDGKFPNYQQVMAQKGNVEVDEVSFNPVLIADVVKASGSNWAGVRVKFGNSDMNNILSIEIKNFPDSKVGLMTMRFGN